MKDRPITICTQLILPTLDGSKTMTRKVIKPQPKWTRNITQSALKPEEWLLSGTMGIIKCPYGKVGDRLWVKETWSTYMTSTEHFEKDKRCVWYKATLPKFEIPKKDWKSPIFMPRWVSRITLEITDIRVERLQEISERDSEDEGVFGIADELKQDAARHYCGAVHSITAKHYFHMLWNSLAKKGFKWEDNPWVWGISFKNLHKGG